MSKSSGARIPTEPPFLTLVHCPQAMVATPHFKTDTLDASRARQSKTEASGDPPEPLPEEPMLVPDSTTTQGEGKPCYSCGDDVFVHKDGRYYLGTVMRVEEGGDRWLVRFGDETERWAAAPELRPLSQPGEADAPAMCVVCKLRSTPHELLACDKCGRGYHRTCQDPPVHSWIPGASWQCRRCVDQRYKVAALENRAMRKEMLKMKQIHRPPDTLPYDLSMLHWDPQHRTNTEQIYCYCGGTGDWFGQMLQCARCRQWFHQGCLSCLKYPLYTGDRFYMFVCSLCNSGTEFIRRLELKWVDLVHLMLFNLTAYNCKKYYDLDTILIPYIMDNWYALQLPHKMQMATPAERREAILFALSNNRNRFKCGREIKKRTTIWGLRARAPPPPPPTPSALPLRGPLTEQALAARWGAAGRVAFIPEPDSSSSSQELGKQNQRMIVAIDGHWLSIMMGKRFQSSTNSSDNESVCSTPSPVDFPASPTNNATYSFKNKTPSAYHSTDDREESPYIFKEDIPLEQPVTPQAKRKELKLYEMDFQGGGFVKKSVPFPKLSLTKRKKIINSMKQRNKKRKNSRKDGGEVDLDKDETFTRTKKMLRNTLAKQQKNKTSRTLSSKGTNTPPVQDESVFSLLKQSSISKDTNNTYEVTMKTNEVILPPTPPTSVSAPPTPPATTAPSSSSSSNDVPPDFQDSQNSKKISCAYDSDQDNDFSKVHIESGSSCSDHSKQASLKTPTKKKNEEHPVSSFNGAFTKSHNSKIAAINLEFSKLSTKNIVEHSKIMSLHHINTNDAYSLFVHHDHDSSGDESSSRGTLDLIIPPPVNFQGRNNPFHLQANTSSQSKHSHSSSLPKGNSSIASKLFNRHSLSKPGSNGHSSVKQNRISLPASLSHVITPIVHKPLKRQLSEKDLVIGPNGEVKRRRHRRSRKNGQLLQVKDGIITERQKSLRSSLGQEELTKQGISPADIQQISTCGDYSQNVRCLRQRQEKNYCDVRRGSTSSSNANNCQINNANVSLNVSSGSNNPGLTSSGVRSLNLSPQKSGSFKGNQSTTHSSESMEDLKKVHSYFGAANRITAGEKFNIVGKRLTESGTMQYLIEWEGHGS